MREYVKSRTKLNTEYIKQQEDLKKNFKPFTIEEVTMGLGVELLKHVVETCGCALHL